MPLLHCTGTAQTQTMVTIDNKNKNKNINIMMVLMVRRYAVTRRAMGRGPRAGGVRGGYDNPHVTSLYVLRQLEAGTLATQVLLRHCSGAALAGEIHPHVVTLYSCCSLFVCWYWYLASCLPACNGPRPPCNGKGCWSLVESTMDGTARPGSRSEESRQVQAAAGEWVTAAGSLRH